MCWLSARGCGPSMLRSPVPRSFAWYGRRKCRRRWALSCRARSTLREWVRQAEIATAGAPPSPTVQHERACQAPGHSVARSLARRSWTGRSASSAAPPGAKSPRSIAPNRIRRAGRPGAPPQPARAGPPLFSRADSSALAEAAHQVVVVPPATAALTDRLELLLRIGGRDRHAVAPPEDQSPQARGE